MVRTSWAGKGSRCNLTSAAHNQVEQLRVWTFLSERLVCIRDNDITRVKISPRSKHFIFFRLITPALLSDLHRTVSNYNRKVNNIEFYFPADFASVVYFLLIFCPRFLLNIFKSIFPRRQVEFLSVFDWFSPFLSVLTRSGRFSMDTLPVGPVFITVQWHWMRLGLDLSFKSCWNCSSSPVDIFLQV